MAGVAAVALVQSLARKLSHATDAAKKYIMEKKKKERKTWGSLLIPKPQSQMTPDKKKRKKRRKRRGRGGGEGEGDHERAQSKPSL